LPEDGNKKKKPKNGKKDARRGGHELRRIKTPKIKKGVRESFGFFWGGHHASPTFPLETEGGKKRT